MQAEALSEEQHKTPTISQIAERLELSEEEVLEAVQADSARRTLSLDVPRGTEDTDAELIIDTVGGPEAGYDRVEAQLAAENAQLTERERTVLRLRFEDDLKQREIGRRLGVSQMQVSRIMRTALGKILAAVQGDDPSESPSGPV